MNNDYQKIIGRFMQAGLGEQHEVRVNDFDESPKIVAGVLIEHYTGKEYSIPRGAIQETEMGSKVNLYKNGFPLVVVTTTRVGNKTRASVVDLELVLLTK